MTGMLPVVEQLLDCETDAERARWLLTVPLIVLYRDQVAIRQALRAARFTYGEVVLDAEVAALSAVRSDFGFADGPIRDSAEKQRRKLAYYVRQCTDALRLAVEE